MVFNSSALFSIACCLFLVSCGEAPSKTQGQSKKTSLVKEKAQSPFSVKTFKENGWGYDILRNGKRYIHQSTKPAVGGNIGFETELQAKKVGEFVLQKIEQGVIPPSVTSAEVDSLMQLYKN